jgi:hypothetical protein
MNIASEAAFETVIEDYLLQHGYEQVLPAHAGRQEDNPVDFGLFVR